MKKSLHHPWLKAGDIDLHPSLHSTSLSMVPVLLALPKQENPRIGYFYAGLMQEWRMDGSPNDQHPTHFMPLPPLPYPKPNHKKS